jgi:hypothetical protein
MSCSYTAGSDLEIEYSLMTFGAPCGILFQKQGHAKRQEIHDGFKRRHAELETMAKKKQLEEETKSRVFLAPNPKDVLIGRGRPYQDFSGNRRLAFLIDANLKRYREHSRFEKTCLTMDLVKSVLAYGGRFIERTDLGWKLIDESAAREKISRGFRTKFAKNTAASGGATADAAGAVVTKIAMLETHTPLDNMAAKRLRYTQEPTAVFVR